MNLYLLNGQYLFTDLELVDKTPLVRGAFSNDEITFCSGFSNGEIVIDAAAKAKSFSDYKDAGKDRIRAAFENELQKGAFASAVLDIDVDCRRSAVKNDLQNVESLIAIMTAAGATTVQYRGVSETVPASLDALKALSLEMMQYGLNLYNKKWLLESQIDAALTISDVDAIRW